MKKVRKHRIKLSGPGVEDQHFGVTSVGCWGLLVGKKKLI
jgi:hypothetical protein